MNAIMLGAGAGGSRAIHGARVISKFQLLTIAHHAALDRILPPSTTIVLTVHLAYFR